jgi:hypothetical protein
MPTLSHSSFSVMVHSKGMEASAVDLRDRLFPLGLVADLAVHVRKAVVRDDLGRVEVLELGRIRPGFFGQADEQFGALQVAIVVGGNVGDEVGGVVGADEAEPILISMVPPFYLSLRRHKPEAISSLTGDRHAPRTALAVTSNLLITAHFLWITLLYCV